MRKLTTALLTMLVLLLLTACNSEQKAVTESAEGFLTALVNIDKSAAAQYATEEFMNSETMKLMDPQYLSDTFFEGMFLGILMWFVFRKMKLKDGVRTGLYLFCYGFIRFFIEYFREPDADLGFILLNFTMGQLLCLLMMMIGVSFILIRSRKTT